MEKAISREYISRFKNSFIVVSLPVILFCLVGPMEIYSGNKNEFLFGIKDFIWVFAFLSLVICVFFAGVVSIFSGIAYKISLLIIFIFSYMSYIQNMFLNNKLMDKAGNAINWDELRRNAIINLFIWIIVIVCMVYVFVIFRDRMVKICTYISTFLALIQVITVITIVISTGYTGIREDELVLSGEDQFCLAPNKNIVVFVLDAYAKDEFIETSKKYPEIQDCFNDFTFYNNADCHFFYTVPSMMHLLTGYNVDYNVLNWQEEAWNTSECELFYNALHENDYTCRLYSSYEANTYFGDLNNLDGKYDNLIYAKPRIDTILMCKLLLKMSIYKYVPYAIKPYFETMTYSFQDTVVYDHSDGSVAYENYEIKESLDRNGLSINDGMNNSFTIMHIQGNHFPYTCDAFGQYSENATDEDAQRALSQILAEYFDYMKKCGIYDNATIIVLADHGLEFSNYEPQPIFLIKKEGEHHNEMQVNSAPISHDDFQATILDIIGEEYYSYGTTIFDHYEGEKRFRQDEISVNAGINVYSYYSDEEELIYNMQNDIYEWRDTLYK